jgi:hypothetical protein
MKLTKNLDKIGTFGLFLIAIVSPCCFPLFAFILSAIGLGSAEFFGGWTEYVFEGLVFISLIGFFIAYRQHKNFLPMLIGLISGGLIVAVYNFDIDSKTIYVGMFGLLFATGFNYYINRKSNIVCKTCTIIEGQTVKLQSTITCPICGYEKEETMPTDTCQFFYECENCKTVLRPKKGDCCVFCSYGTVKCPSKQTGEECC